MPCFHRFRIAIVSVLLVSSAVVTASGSSIYRPVPNEITTGSISKPHGFAQGVSIGSGLPVSVLAQGIVSITTDGHHTCALTAGGGVKCWGANSSGQLGDGTTSDRSTPVNVSELTTGVTAIAAGESHTCAPSTNWWCQVLGWERAGQSWATTTTEHLTCECQQAGECYCDCRRLEPHLCPDERRRCQVLGVQRCRPVG
jgi:alpha-tubulin suppressor-like RCC1 family protein